MKLSTMLLAAALSGMLAAPGLAQDAIPDRILRPRAEPGPMTTQFLSVQAPIVALQHARVIDGTGGPALEDQTVIIENSTITAVGGADLDIPEGAQVLDMSGKSVLPGIVGLHDHLFYIGRPNLKIDGSFESQGGVLAPQMSFSAVRMYLANGVTTLRTAGSVEPYADLNLKTDIDAGLYPGPHLDITSPYLEGPPGVTVQQHRLTGPDDARQMVNYWADQGITSVKAYEHISREDLAATIEAAHERGLTVTAHLCAVTYPEAIELGIDNIEHGFFVNSQLAPDKEPDVCPPLGTIRTILQMPPGNPDREALIASLVENNIAVTSTLGVYEGYSKDLRILSDAAMETLTPSARRDYLLQFTQRKSLPEDVKQQYETAWQNGISMEKDFVDAGGLLVVGSDPTGFGQMLPGFGNHRAIELLVSAGFTPVEAIRIATLNGATLLGLENRIGSIAAGKNADLLIVSGDPSTNIADIENVELVFKDGLGYDTAALLATVRGHYGQY